MDARLEPPWPSRRCKNDSGYGKLHSNLANNLFASSCDSRRPIISFATFHLPGSSWPSVNSPSSKLARYLTSVHDILPGPDDYVAALGSAIGRPARLFFRPKCDVTVSNWSDEREGQNEQVPAYSMRIRTAFVVCIRRGEITGAAWRGKQPDARRRRCSEDGTHPCRYFWNKPADLLFLRSPPRLLRQRYQYPCYQATGTWHCRDRGCNRLPRLRKGKHPPQVQSA